MSELFKPPVSAKDIKEWTSKDALLSTVLRFITKGWLNSVDQPELLPYYLKRNVLNADDKCNFRGSRVVVPLPGHQLTLQGYIVPILGYPR